MTSVRRKDVHLDASFPYGSGPMCWDPKTKAWYLAKVIDVRLHKVKVTFPGWEDCSEYDEWIPKLSDRFDHQTGGKRKWRPVRDAPGAFRRLMQDGDPTCTLLPEPLPPPSQRRFRASNGTPVPGTATQTPTPSVQTPAPSAVPPAQQEEQQQQQQQQQAHSSPPAQPSDSCGGAALRPSEASEEGAGAGCKRPRAEAAAGHGKRGKTKAATSRRHGARGPPEPPPPDSAAAEPLRCTDSNASDDGGEPPSSMRGAAAAPPRAKRGRRPGRRAKAGAEVDSGGGVAACSGGSAADTSARAIRQPECDGGAGAPPPATQDGESPGVPPRARSHRVACGEPRSAPAASARDDQRCTLDAVGTPLTAPPGAARGARDASSDASSGGGVHRLPLEDAAAAPSGAGEPAGAQRTAELETLVSELLATRGGDADTEPAHRLAVARDAAAPPPACPPAPAAGASAADASPGAEEERAHGGGDAFEGGAGGDAHSPLQPAAREGGEQAGGCSGPHLHAAPAPEGAPVAQQQPPSDVAAAPPALLDDAAPPPPPAAEGAEPLPLPSSLLHLFGSSRRKQRNPMSSAVPLSVVAEAHARAASPPAKRTKAQAVYHGPNQSADPPPRQSLVPPRKSRRALQSSPGSGRATALAPAVQVAGGAAPAGGRGGGAAARGRPGRRHVRSMASLTSPGSGVGSSVGAASQGAAAADAVPPGDAIATLDDAVAVPLDAAYAAAAPLGDAAAQLGAIAAATVDATAAALAQHAPSPLVQMPAQAQAPALLQAPGATSAPPLMHTLWHAVRERAVEALQDTAYGRRDRLAEGWQLLQLLLASETPECNLGAGVPAASPLGLVLSLLRAQPPQARAQPPLSQSRAQQSLPQPLTQPSLSQAQAQPLLFQPRTQPPLLQPQPHAHSVVPQPWAQPPRAQSLLPQPQPLTAQTAQGLGATLQWLLAQGRQQPVSVQRQPQPPPLAWQRVQGGSGADVLSPIQAMLAALHSSRR